MSKIRKAFAFTGILLVFSAVLLTFNPGLIPESALPLPRDLLLTGFLLVFMFLFGLYGFQSFRFGGIEESDVKLKPESNPEGVKDKGEKHSLKFGWEENEEAKKEMRETLVKVLVDKYNCSEEKAEKTYREGEWTESKTAAAFICKEIRYPVLERLREWLEEEGTFERRRQKTVEQIEKLHKGGEK